MIQAACYGRLGQTPRQLETSSGKVMAASTLAVDMTTARDENADPLWLGILTFGKVAEMLLRHSKGDLVSISGRVQRNTWTDKQTGETREQLQVIADSLVSARSVRPSGGRKKKPETRSPGSGNDALPFDDPLP